VSDQPPATGLSPSARATLGARLASERDETSARLAGLVHQFDAIVESSALSASDDEHDPEGATVGFERAQVAALVAQARRRLDDVEAARRRLDAGTYGVCERCGEGIGFDRLVAHPSARTCVACAGDGSRGFGSLSPRGS